MILATLLLLYYYNSHDYNDVDYDVDDCIYSSTSDIIIIIWRYNLIYMWCLLFIDDL